MLLVFRFDQVIRGLINSDKICIFIYIAIFYLLFYLYILKYVFIFGIV